MRILNKHYFIPYKRKPRTALSFMTGEEIEREREKGGILRIKNQVKRIEKEFAKIVKEKKKGGENRREKEKF